MELIKLCYKTRISKKKLLNWLKELTLPLSICTDKWNQRKLTRSSRIYIWLTCQSKINTSDLFQTSNKSDLTRHSWLNSKKFRSLNLTYLKFPKMCYGCSQRTSSNTRSLLMRLGSHSSTRGCNRHWSLISIWKAKGRKDKLKLMEKLCTNGLVSANVEHFLFDLT